MAMKDISAERLRELLVYEHDTGLFRWRVTRRGRAIRGSIAGNVEKRGYISICVDGSRYWAHRLAWLYCHGEMPPAMLDHINRIKGDNRIDNLRLSNSFLNQRNVGLASNNSSGYTGVMLDAETNKWNATIVEKKKNIFLGSFFTKEEAAAAREGAERILFYAQ